MFCQRFFDEKTLDEKIGVLLLDYYYITNTFTTCTLLALKSSKPEVTESGGFRHSRRSGSELNISDFFREHLGLPDDLVTLGIACRFKFFPINDARRAFGIIEVDDLFQV